MSEELEALYDGRRMGTLSYQRDRLTFHYDGTWRNSPEAFPLSLSMPLASPEHPDAVVRPFISGLLPDNDEVLRRWGQRFHVSHRNPYRLLTHVGEECAGAIQFVLPERAPAWLEGNAPEGVSWLTDEELAERIRILVEDHAGARRLGDQGHFSLAGAQAKTGLLHDLEGKRWGVPMGATPTTHILKPATGDYEGYTQNEHFCLRLAAQVGLAAAHSWIEVIDEVPVIIVERFDRTSIDGKYFRIHQEDSCQALAKMPDRKYQNEGGPSAKDILGLIRDRSSKPFEDATRFLDALIFNWFIGGTDAHAKNYALLLAGGGQVRLAPLYDLSSCLPYPQSIPIRRAKLAMKIGGTYELSRVSLRSWEKAAKDWKLDRDLLFERIASLAAVLPAATQAVAAELEEAIPPNMDVLNLLVQGICQRADEQRELLKQ